jgi:uncharacterized protein (TIGR02266 family)
MADEQKRGPTSLVVDYEDADDLCLDFRHNLSGGQTFVQTDLPLKIGDEVTLNLTMPRLIKPLVIEGVVRWVRAISDGEQGVGIEFSGFDQERQAAIEEDLQHIQNKDPAYVRPILKVLLVEDNPYVCKLVQEGLEAGRYPHAIVECTGVDNGRDALELMHTQSFDVLVIDIHMPLVDGATVIATIRKEELYKNLPVIAFSAGGQAAREEAMKAGADSFLEKPLRLKDILATMERLLENPQ